jgi:formylglycine-generating enzyme required for sulfatase activity
VWLSQTVADNKTGDGCYSMGGDMVRVCFVFMVAVAALWCSGEPMAGTRIVHPVDGAVMVYVPSGTFTMGLSREEGEVVAKLLGFESGTTLWVAEAWPQRRVEVGGFFIDRCEVTVGQWQRYLEATGGEQRPWETVRHFGKPDAVNLPAGEIAWRDAISYADWAGKALPTEAQWEKAARGEDGRLFPWGNDAPTEAHGHWKGRLYVKVGSFPLGASPYGALDMLGNQYEWTIERKRLYPDNPLRDDEPNSKMIKEINDGRDVCLRGGSWYHGQVGFYAAKRFGFGPEETHYHVGFRTVWVPAEGYFESAEFAEAKAKAAALSD